MNKWNVKRYISNIFDSNCFLVTNGIYSIVIDPSVSYEIIKKDIKGKFLGVLITHGHFDHFSEIESFMKIPNVLFYCHKNAIKKLENNVYNCSKLCNMDIEIKTDERFITVSKGQIEMEKDFSIEVMETPGHTDCSICFLIDDLIFTGDFLFNGSIGRTDLYTGSSVVMNKSLQEFKNDKSLKKYYDYVIYPGHENITTLDNELKTNPYLL